jgi:hypothetical protein
MPSPSAVFTEMVSTTLRDHKKDVADAVSNHNAVLRRLLKKGKHRVSDGGYEIVCPLEWAENNTFMWYSGAEPLDVGESDVVSAAKYDWKQAATHVVSHGLQLRQNSGRAAMINLSKTKLRNAVHTLKNNLSIGVYSDGLGSGGKQLTGLQAQVADAGTGTVGGIDSSSIAIWRNKVQSAAAPLQGGGAITPSKSTIKSLMNPLDLALTRGGDRADLWVFDDTYFTYYWESLQDLQRYASADEADAGFMTLKFRGSDVIYESAASGMPDAHGYALNTDYIELVVHEDANITEMEQKASVNQDAVVIPIIWQGNLCTSNRALQGVLKA